LITVGHHHHIPPLTLIEDAPVEMASYSVIKEAICNTNHIISSK